VARAAARARADRRHRLAERHRSPGQALIAYLDTSAFVKLIIPEHGSAEVIANWQSADRRISSVLLYAEARSAIGRAGRGRRLRKSVVSSRRRQLETLWAATDRLEVTERLVRLAGDLAERHRLRVYDAVHLASAVSVADAELVVVAADGDLLAAARRLGLATARLP